jgi:UDP-glucose 4-epimerase
VKALITGGSGYIGSRLVELLAGRGEVERVVVADVNPPRFFLPKVQYERLDVRDGAACRKLLAEVEPDTVVHLAFIVNPVHDEALMYEVDVNGTANVLEAAAAAGTQHVLVTSSTTAYGAFPDNPVPISEDWPVRGVSDYAYARDKTEADRLCQLWALKHPERTMTIVRPCIVFGPNVDNYLVRFWTKQPFQADTGNLDLPFQFVHEEDVVDAISGLLLGGHGGAFNVTADGLISLRECAEVAGLPIRRMPKRAFTAIAKTMWAARMSEAPAGQIRFTEHPWVASNEKVKSTLGWQPKHTSRETLEATIRAHKGTDEATPAAAAPKPAAPVA